MSCFNYVCKSLYVICNKRVLDVSIAQSTLMYHVRGTLARHPTSVVYDMKGCISSRLDIYVVTLERHSYLLFVHDVCMNES